MELRLKRTEAGALAIGAAMLCCAGGIGVAGEPASLATAGASDARQLSGVWTSLPPNVGGSRGPPVRGAAASPPATPSAAAPPAFDPVKARAMLVRKSTPPVVKAAYQDRFKPGQLAPHQGPLRNNDASMLCVPDIFTGTGGGYPTLIMQTRNQITLVNEENHRFRRIYLDRPHPRRLTPSYAGHSVGHWEGDALVVDTVGLRERDGVVHPPGFRIVERLQKQSDGRTLHYTVSFHSDAYETPGVNDTVTWYLRPELHIQESACEEFPDNFNEDYFK